MILDQIVHHKRREIAQRRQAAPLEELQARAAAQPGALDMTAALRGGRGRLIAEVKRASPSRGELCPGADPATLARLYAANGAAAISVLTDVHFQGSLDHLAQVRQALGAALPLLCKDFILDPYQLYEARARGADAVLLIAAILEDERLADLAALTGALGMSALVEVHDEKEIARVLPLRPPLVGINQRDLRDFSVDREAFRRLRPLLPDDTVVVAASGVRDAADVRRLVEQGANAVLVGEALATAGDTAARVRELAGGGR